MSKEEKLAGFTLDDLRRVMREAAGETEAGSLDGEISDASFLDLGYDSLALLEITARVQQQLGITIPDDAVQHMETPAQAVAYVNTLLASGAEGGTQ